MSTETNSIPRREREKLRRREEVLAVALSLFSEKGFHNVSMHEIAEKSEFAVGTLYKFFANKEEIYSELMRQGLETFREALDKAITAPADEIEKLRAYVTIKAELFRSNAALVKLYLSETQGSAHLSVMTCSDLPIREQRRRVLEHLTQIFRRGMDRKIFNKIADPFHLALAIESVTSALLFMWLEDPEHHPFPDEPDAVLAIFFKGLRNETGAAVD